MVEIEAVVVFRACIGILICQPIQNLQQHLGIGLEVWSLGLFLVLLGVLQGLFSLLGLLFITRFFLFGSEGQDLFTIGHDHFALGFRIGSFQDTSPLGHHVGFVVRADGSSNIAVGCHFAQQQAHLHIIVETGTVGIDNHWQGTLLCHYLFQILRAIYRKAWAGGIAHHF